MASRNSYFGIQKWRSFPPTRNTAIDDTHADSSSSSSSLRNGIIITILSHEIIEGNENNEEPISLLKEPKRNVPV
jgi:hypothetical protein